MYKLAAFILGIFLVSCQEPQGDLNLEMKGFDDGALVYLAKFADGNQPVPVDTAEVQSGKVTLNLPDEDFQTLNSLSFDGVEGNVPFINEGKPVKIKVYKDSIGASDVDGGEANQVLMDYRDNLNKINQKLTAMINEYEPEELQKPEVQGKLQAKQKELEEENTGFYKDLIKEHPDALSTVYIFGYLMNSGNVSDEEMKQLYDGLSPEVKESYIGKEIGQEFERMNAVTVGEKAPDFIAKNPDGEEISLADVLEKDGKYTLVEFWASWCPYCQDEMPNVVEVYEDYHDKGLNIIAVSLDDNKDEWVDGIEEFGMDWDHVSNLKKWEDPIVQQYNVSSIPFNFLLDEDGKIIGTDLQDEDLKNKMKELLD